MIGRKTRYARLEGAFWSNDKVCSISLAAVGLHTKAIAYCADKMTDGRVPKWMIPALAVGVDATELVTELLRVTSDVTSDVTFCNTSKKLRPMWIDEGDYYRLHDYEKSNITNAEWEAEKERARKGMAKKRSENNEIQSDKPDDEIEDVTRNTPVTLQRSYRRKTQDSGLRTNSEKNIVGVADDIRPVSPPISPDPGAEPDSVRIVFDHWKAKHWTGHGVEPKLDAKRRVIIAARLRERWTVAQLCEAVDGCLASAWHMGDNPGGKRYNSLGLILRSAENIEKFIAAGMSGAGLSHAAVAPDFTEQNKLAQRETA